LFAFFSILSFCFFPLSRSFFLSNPISPTQNVSGFFHSPSFRYLSPCSFSLLIFMPFPL
jgi:hypothetical protein